MKKGSIIPSFDKIYVANLVKTISSTPVIEKLNELRVGSLSSPFDENLHKALITFESASRLIRDRFLESLHTLLVLLQLCVRARVFL